MTDHNFADEEVIKTLKNAKYKVDGVVTRGYYLSPDTFNAVVDLIGRQEAEIERLNTVHADMTESLRLAAEANKDMSVELDAMRGAANSYKMHYEETERKYKIAVAEREANVKGFIETLETIKAEAIKEFAERLIDKCTDPHWCVWMSEIEDLVTEMTENKR
jgi:hypothetical protein